MPWLIADLKIHRLECYLLITHYNTNNHMDSNMTESAPVVIAIWLIFLHRECTSWTVFRPVYFNMFLIICDMLCAPLSTFYRLSGIILIVHIEC